MGRRPPTNQKRNSPDASGGHRKLKTNWLDHLNTTLAFLAALGGLGAAAAGYYQVRVARDVEERQLRAYVLVNKSDLRDFGSEKPFVVMLELKNFGSSPAYELRRRIQAFAGNYPLQKMPELPPLGMNKSVLGPGGEVDLGPARATVILTPAQVSEIEAGRWAIYAHGAFSYLDAFGTLRCTRFNLLYRGNGTKIAPDTILPLEQAAEENNSDDKCDAIPVEK